MSNDKHANLLAAEQLMLQKLKTTTLEKNTDWSPHKCCIQSNGVGLSGESRRSIIWKGSDQFWTEEGAFEYIFHPWLHLGRLWPKFHHRTSSLRIYVNVHVPACCFVTGQTCLCRIYITVHKLHICPGSGLWSITEMSIRPLGLQLSVCAIEYNPGFTILWQRPFPNSPWIWYPWK